MNALSLTLACGDFDRTRALADGTVRPEGVNLIYLALPGEEIQRRMLGHEEFDVAELSIASYIIGWSRGIRRFVAIPVFPFRTFRHSNVYVNTDANIESPQDLAGKRMGLPDYGMTAAVWVRAFLQHDYGVFPEQIQWVIGGVLDATAPRTLAVDLLPSVRSEASPAGRTLDEMLAAGEIDALVSRRPPPTFLRGSPKVARLFPDYRKVEVDYYQRTGLFPIMHTIILRQELHVRYPWLAYTLYRAFWQAKEVCFRAMGDPMTLRYSLAWWHAELEMERQILGDDLWPYGIESNRRTLNALVTYLYEQGLTPALVEVEKLFAETTWQ